MSGKRFNQSILPVMFGFFIMGFVDIVGVATSYVKADFEKSLVDTVRRLNTEEAYDQLIELLYDYADIATIENEREFIAYDAIKHCGELAQYQRYLDKYGNLNRAHHFTIEWRRDSTAFEQLGKTAAACKAYLAAYPHSQFNNSVQELLHKYILNRTGLLSIFKTLFKFLIITCNADSSLASKRSRLNYNRILDIT